MLASAPMPTVSVVLPISPRARSLDATLDSYAEQVGADFELVVVGEGERATRAMERVGGRVPVVLARHAITTRGAARLAGLGAASGEVILFAAEDQPAVPGCVAAVAREGAEEPALVVGSQARVDPLFARVAPLVDRFGERLSGLALPWLAALGGHYSLPRRTLQDFSLDQGYSGWAGDDLDLPFRWWSGGLPIRVSARAACGGAARELEDWPPTLANDVGRFAERNGVLDGWLLWRFLRGDPFDAIHGVALERARGRTRALDELGRVAGEVLGTSLRATREWWHP